jgi:hypothetical protein
MTTNRWLLAGIATCIALPAHAVDLEQQMDFNIRGCDGPDSAARPPAT